jgi:hydroxypyruvate isomerase
MLRLVGGTVGATAFSGVAEAGNLFYENTAAQKYGNKNTIVKGNLKQSVAGWCFTTDVSVKPVTLDELITESAALGIQSVELLDPIHWAKLKEHGLICAMANSHGFVDGFNDKKNHAMCIAEIKKSIDYCADAGFPNVITFSGFRHGIPDDVGLENSIEGLKRVIGYAEKKKVNLVMEVLNSRVNTPMKGHPGYMGDTVEWVGEVCKQIDSPRMKMLFDIYHVQIMQGDIITRIREWKNYIGHYHVAGVPGRNEMNDTQELNYTAVLHEIVKTGYDGYIGLEYIPTTDLLVGLKNAVRLCDV